MKYQRKQPPRWSVVLVTRGKRYSGDILSADIIGYNKTLAILNQKKKQKIFGESSFLEGYIRLDFVIESAVLEGEYREVASHDYIHLKLSDIVFVYDEFQPTGATQGPQNDVSATIQGRKSGKFHRLIINTPKAGSSHFKIEADFKDFLPQLTVNRFAALSNVTISETIPEGGGIKTIQYYKPFLALGTKYMESICYNHV